MMYLAFDNRLFLAPLENPQKVLDLGTGTGIWAMQATSSLDDSPLIWVWLINRYSEQ